MLNSWKVKSLILFDLRIRSDCKIPEKQIFSKFRMKNSSLSMKFMGKKKKGLNGTCINHNNQLLLQAVKVGNEILVDKLIASGIHLEFSDEFGCGPVYYASRYNHPKILKILVEAGAPIHSTTIMKRSPLQISAYHGHLECVKYLLSVGADCDAVDHLGMTALHWAAENNHMTVVDVLIKAGASQNIVSNFGKTAKQLAFLKNNFNLCKLFDIGTCVSDVFFPDKESTPKNYSHVYMTDNEISSHLPIFKRSILGKSLRDHLNGKDDPMKLLEKHGIKMLPVDDSTLIVNALKSGQKAVLTEAGRLALQITQSDVIRGLYEPVHIIKKPKIDEQRVLTVAKFNKSVIDGNKGRKQPPKSEKSVIKQCLSSLSDVPPVDPILQNTTTEQYPTDKSEQNEAVSKIKDAEERIKFLEKELVRSTQLANDFRRQLGLSVQLIQNYKNKYEMKDREASLYKLQLLNILKIISKKQKNSKLKA